MKLVFYEIKKVLCKKVFFIILALCFVLNLAMFYYIQENSSNRQFIRSDYPSMADEYSCLTLEEAEEMLSNESKAYEILALMDTASYAQTDDELDYLLDTLSDCKENFPGAYSAAEKMRGTGDYDENRESYIYTLLSQVNYIKSYPDFIDGMYGRAEEQSSFSIFSNENEFSYKNLYKTAADYEHLSGITLTVGNDLPVTSASQYTVTDWLLIALVFLVCIYLFNQEKELGLCRLVRCTKHGRLKTIAAKFCALFLLTAAVTIVFVLSNYAMSACLFGSFDISRSVQSVSDFRNCIFALNLGQFCLLNILGKAAVMIIISAIFAFLFVCFSSPSLTYITAVVILAVEFLLKSLVPPSTAFNYPKYINLFYMLDSGSFFGSYLNLNIFTNPVSVYTVDLIIFSAIFAACTVTSLIAFALKGQQVKSGFLSAFAENFRLRHFKINGSTKIIGGEAYKYLVTNKMALLALIAVAFGIFSGIGTVSYPYSTKSDPAYKEYMEYFEGDITPEKESYIAQQREYFENLNKRMGEIEADSNLSASTKEVAANTITNILDTKGAAFDRVNEQYTRLLELKKSGIEAKFIDENLYPYFIYSPSREWGNLTLALLALLISVPFIFSVEYKRQTVNLVRCTRFGKLRLALNKLLIAFVTLIVIFAAVYLPFLIRFISTFGTGGFSVPIVCLELYRNTTGGISVIGAFALGAACYFAALLFAAALTALMSVLLKSHMLSLIISTVLVIFPCLIIYPYNNVRAGAIFFGGYSISAALIISVCTLLALLCAVTSVIKFTNTSFGRKNR